MTNDAAEAASVLAFAVHGVLSGRAHGMVDSAVVEAGTGEVSLVAGDLDHRLVELAEAGPALRRGGAHDLVDRIAAAVNPLDIPVLLDAYDKLLAIAEVAPEDFLHLPVADDTGRPD